MFVSASAVSSLPAGWQRWRRPRPWPAGWRAASRAPCLIIVKARRPRAAKLGHYQGKAMPKSEGSERLKRKVYEEELRKLQVELCRLQEWIKVTRERVIVVLEGRDAAGKGGTIKAITERVSPRVFRVVALPAPSDREKSQLYMQ